MPPGTLNTRPHRRSIQAKLTLLVVASVSVAVVSLATFSTFRDSRRELALQKDRYAATAAVIGSLSGEATARGDRPAAYAALRSINAAPGVIYARIETADGQLLAETGAGVRLERDAKVSEGGEASLLALLRSRTVEVSAPVAHGRERVGEVVLLARLEGAGERLAASLLTGLLAAALAGGVGAVVAWRLQRGISRPIQALTRAIADLRSGRDFSGRVEVTANDETADLVDGFNALISEVRARDAALEAHLAGLERTVEQRTADLRAAKDAADAANSAKSDFLATMSHEIRTPMNGIMVMAEMLATSEMPPRQRRFAEVIAKSGSSLLAIINDILDFSKIEAGKLELESAAVDPEEIVDDVLSLFWERARSKGLELAAYVHPDAPARVEADPVRLRQVISNLVNNAIKFTQSGGVIVEVSSPGPNRLRVAVRDTGIGIPQDKLPGLFAAFTQADQSTTRRFGGTGLGLAICKRLVEAMGGRMAVRSVLGHGSAFAFEAPLRAIAPPCEPSRFEGAVDLRVSGQFTASVLRRQLEALGLTLARPGEPAVLVVTDADRALEDDGRKFGPVICLAGFSDPAPAELLRQGKVDALLTLPVRRRELEALLQAWRDGAPLSEGANGPLNAQVLPTFGAARVLVADDSAVNLEVAKEALARLGIACQTVCDGRAAIEALEQQRFDLVLMDGSMPVMDGYEAARYIRQRETENAQKRTPIVALTAHVVGEAADFWREAGMDAVLPKPFTLASLGAVISQFLQPTGQVLTDSTPLPEGAPAVTDLIDQVVAG